MQYNLQIYYKFNGYNKQTILFQIKCNKISAIMSITITEIFGWQNPFEELGQQRFNN